VGISDNKKLKEGHQEIEIARKLGSKTAKEQGFLTATGVLYQEKGKLTHEERVKAYSAAMGKFHEAMPDDVEVGAFTALSLVALAEEEDVDSLANQEKAIAILNPLFEKYPDHPGVAHYLIHDCDRPESDSAMRSICRRIFLCDWGCGRTRSIRMSLRGPQRGAQTFYADLMKIWWPGADRQELAEAKTVAALQ
jgi:hypothetical protein